MPVVVILGRLRAVPKITNSRRTGSRQQFNARLDAVRNCWRSPVWREWLGSLAIEQSLRDCAPFHFATRKPPPPPNFVNGRFAKPLTKSRLRRGGGGFRREMKKRRFRPAQLLRNLGVLAAPAACSNRPVGLSALGYNPFFAPFRGKNGFPPSAAPTTTTASGAGVATSVHLLAGQVRALSALLQGQWGEWAVEHPKG